MKKQGIIKRTLENRVKGKTNWNRVKAMTEEEIRQSALSDPDAQPTNEAFWKNAEIVIPIVMDEKIYRLAKKRAEKDHCTVEQEINTILAGELIPH
jgi:hypothetical protein